MNLGHDQFIINEGNNLSYINDLLNTKTNKENLI